MKKFTCFYVWIISALINVVASVSSQRIHEFMTQEELVQTFGNHDNIPEYEVIPIYYSHRNRRSIGGKIFVTLQPFGRNIELWLEPIDGTLVTDTTPVYGVSKSPYTRNATFTKYTDAFRILEPYVYKEYKTRTTLAMHRYNNRQKRMVGIIGSENLVISPLQERLISTVTRQRRSIDNIPKSQRDEHHYHVVFKRSTNNIFKPFTNSLRKNQAIQDVIYPEILVIVEYNLYKVFNEMWDSLLLYLIAFWNGVDLLYRPLTNPKYRLNIAAILIAEDDYGLKYVAWNREGNNKVKYAQALEDSQSWLYENIPSIMNTEDYDVAMTMTSRDLCKEQYDRTCPIAAMGSAYIGAACLVNDYYRRVYKTSIVNDIGAFSGIHTAAHELGHSFGSEHDGVGVSSRCPQNFVSMMHPSKQFKYKGWMWSRCSLNQFGKLLETTGKCLLNKPKYGQKLVRILPGKRKDANEQCRMNFKSRAVRIDATICKELWCYHQKNPMYLHSAGPAADGTPCGDKKMCLHGMCISNSTIRYP